MRIVFLMLFTITAFAQKPKVYFFEDSVMVGKEIKMALSYRHSSKSDILFPDSSFDFSPFQFVSYELFETKTEQGKSRDSVVYTLVTYALDSVLYLQPYIKNLASGVKVYSDSASVFLKSSISGKAQKRVRETVPLYVVKKDVNLPKLTYYLLGMLVFGFLLFVFFGDWVKIKYSLWKFDRRHKRFLVEFKKRSGRPKLLNNNERAVQEWKIYMEALEGVPVSTMSTSELGKLYPDPRLEYALKMFDSAIFGGVISEELPVAYQIMEDFAVRRYRYLRRSSGRK